ncbi:MAG TPA: PAS domain S-box protein, partial [Casimicrobiaceae bacterium]
MIGKADMQNQIEPGANLQVSLHERERLATLYGDVGLALTRSGSLREVLQSCAEAVVRNLDAAFARIWILNPQTNVLELAASAGLYTHLDGPHSRVPVGQFKIGLIAAERKPHLTNSVVGDPRVSDQEWARREGMVAFAGYPLVVEDQTVGVLAMFARQRLSPILLQSLETVAYGTALLIKQKRDEEALRASEKRKTAILETALDCIITIDRDGTVLEFNPAAERTFGYTREQALGRKMLELIIPKELRERHAGDVEDYLSGAGQPQFERRFETTAMRANGFEFPIELAVVRINMDGSDLFTVFLRDITARRQAEQQRERLLADAEAAQRSYRELAESMPQQVWTAQPDGTLDYINQRGLDYFRRSSGELLAAGWLAVVHPGDAPAAIERWRHSLQTGEPYEVEFRLAQGGTGQYSWHLGRAAAIRDHSGAIVRWIGTNTDIQDRKKVEEDLQEAKANADFANQAKSQFLASMSHELRTPLNAVIGYSEMLQEEATERGLTELVPDLKKIHRAGSYLLNLINNVLDLSKIEAGKMELYLETFDVAGMLDDVALTVEPLIARNGNRLE